MHTFPLWDAWSITGPWTLSPLSGGTNKQVWRAEAADGKKYVLHLTSNRYDLPRIRYEHALLKGIASTHLPFLLPLQLQAQNGDIIVEFETEAGIPMYATLSEFLPGQPLQDRSDLVLAKQAAITLALLDKALATLPDPPLPEGLQPPPLFGDLANCHPLIQDPLTALEQLPIAAIQARQIRQLLQTAMEKTDALYDQLPQQLLHSDYDPANILIDIAKQQITAVLDFEFAGRGLRALDVCVALSWWPVHVMGTGNEWEIIGTFGRAYIEHFPLTEQELLAFPDILRLRDATSFVHRMGRYLAGMETETRIQDRVAHSLWREQWLSMHQERLLRHALSWIRR